MCDFSLVALGFVIMDLTEPGDRRRHVYLPITKVWVEYEPTQLNGVFHAYCGEVRENRLAGLVVVGTGECRAGIDLRDGMFQEYLRRYVCFPVRASQGSA